MQEDKKQMPIKKTEAKLPKKPEQQQTLEPFKMFFGKLVFPPGSLNCLIFYSFCRGIQFILYILYR